MTIASKINISLLLERIAKAQERIADTNEKTLKAYADTNQLTLEHMKARESREIFQSQRAAERHEWDRDTYKKQQELIQAKIDEANRYIK
jgi:hypothetical protein